MSTPLCPACGWGSQPPCKTVEDIVRCCLNWENRRKYHLRNKGKDAHERFVAFRSVRHQGPKGKGDCSERFEPLTIEQLRDVMKREAA